MKLDKLYKLRRSKGFTHLDMAEKLKISKPFYCLIENGKRTLKYSTAVAIAEIFNTKPDDIFYEDVTSNTD